MKRILLVITIVGGVCGIFSCAVWHLTDGFSLAKMTSELTFSPRREVKQKSNRESLNLLNQNFYYIGKGSQCFVFESEDKQVILKFFRHSRYRLSKIALLLADAEKKEAKQKKLAALFQSCKIGIEELSDESGLLYAHLNKTNHIQKTVVLYDKLKRAYPINIDDYEFVLQVHAEHIFPYLTRLIEKGKKNEARAALLSLADIHASRIGKGIIDQDVVIHKNSGFNGTKAIFLDIGSFARGSVCTDTKKELWNSTRELREWLHEKDQSLAHYFEQVIASY